jgi:hypothetical protein
VSYFGSTKHRGTVGVLSKVYSSVRSWPSRDAGVLPTCCAQLAGGGYEKAETGVESGGG